MKLNFYLIILQKFVAGEKKNDKSFLAVARYNRHHIGTRYNRHHIGFNKWYLQMKQTFAVKL